MLNLGQIDVDKNKPFIMYKIKNFYSAFCKKALKQYFFI